MINQDLGIATAYGYAKSKGYTGSEDDFATLMANYASVGTSAAASALKSEGFAVGEQNGTPVTSGSPYYQNNAKYYVEQIDGALALAYSSSSTYDVGDYVMHSGGLYRCTTAITTAEAWTAGHWTQVSMADEVSDLKTDFIQPIIDGGCRVTDNLVDFFFDAKEWVQGRPNGIGAIYAIHNKNKVNVSEGDVIYCAVKDIVYPSGTLYITLYTYDSSNTFVSAVDLKYKSDGENSYTIPSDVAYCYVGVDTKSTSRPLSLATMQAMNAKIYVGESNVKYINIYPKYEIIASKAQSDVDLIKDFSAYDLTGISSLAVGSVHVVDDDDTMDFYNKSVIDYRIGTPKILQYDDAITLLPDPGYRIDLFVKENGQSSYAVLGWKTTAVTIPAKAKWAMTVARTPEDTSVPADLETFKQAVKTSIPTSTLKTRVQNIENAINSEDGRLTVNARYADRLDSLAQMTRLPMFLVFTDIHGFGKYLERIGEFYKSNFKDYCKDAICLGDIVYDKFSDDFTFMTDSEFGKRVLLTIGNHDCYNGVTVGGVPQADMYAKFFTDVDLWNVTQPTNASTDSLMYYYKDYSNKIRLIVLDEYYWDSDELTWFANVLDDARTNNLSVIVAQHQGNFGELEYSALDNHAFGTDETSFIRTTDGYQDRRNAVDTFVTNGGDFIGWINGHSHCEQFGTFEVNGHKQFNMTFSNAGQDGTSRVKRPDYSMDCFYYLAVDTTSKYVYVLTIGQAENKWFKRNLMLAYDYANHEVVQYY